MPKALRRTARFLALGLATVLLTGCGHPSDSDLEENFYRHEADFNRLIEMSNEDARVLRISPDFTHISRGDGLGPDSDVGFTKERWQEYRRLFSKLGLDGGLTRSEHPHVIVILWASGSGIVGHGSAKGYAYSTKEPSPLVDSAGRFPVPPGNGGHVYKRIKQNWYIYYDWD